MVVLIQQDFQKGKWTMTIDVEEDFNPKKTDKIKTLNNAIDNWNPWGLSGRDLAVWAVLFRHEWDGLAMVSQSVIHEVTGFDHRTIQKAIESLVEKKVISIVKKGISRINITVYRLKRKWKKAVQKTKK